MTSCCVYHENILIHYPTNNNKIMTSFLPFFILHFYICVFIEANDKLFNINNEHDLRRKKPVKGSHPQEKNDVSELFKVQQICMDVCNPSYDSQQYPPSYNNQFNQWQYSPDQYIPVDQAVDPYPNNYGYGNYEYNQMYPQDVYGGYNPWCYRNMFRKRYNFDPGYQKPSVINYRKLYKRRTMLNRHNNRNYNYYQGYSNCQLICYPMMVPSTPNLQTSASSPQKPTITTTKHTKKPSTTTTEEAETDKPSAETDATAQPTQNNNATTVNVTSTAKPSKKSVHHKVKS